MGCGSGKAHPSVKGGRAESGYRGSSKGQLMWMGPDDHARTISSKADSASDAPVAVHVKEARTWGA